MPVAAGVRRPAVYVMASQRNGTVYVGVTSDLVTRAAQHRSGALPGFTTRYGCKLLVYFELYDDMTTAILREKQIKAGSRSSKIALVESVNPIWRDLFDEIV